MAKWKRPVLKKYFKNDIIKYIPLEEELRFSQKIRKNKFLLNRTVFLVWGMKEPYDLIPFSEQYGIPIWRVEDGFIRSIGLGSERSLPFSLCIDKSGIYFNSECPSDLESLIIRHQNSISKNEIRTAERLIDKIKKYGFSKYNNFRPNNYKLTNNSDRKKVIVIGQVEDDQSIIFGTSTPLTNMDLLEVAINENPDSDIYFKAHPDYISSKRNNISDISGFEDVYLIPNCVPLSYIFEQVDHVYTISSLGGFEALLYDKKVTVLGGPFYSGWGLTDDRHKVSRRNIKVDIKTLFSAAYIKYPCYLNPISGKSMNLEAVLDDFQEEIKIESSYSNYVKENLYNAKTKADIDIRYLNKYNEIFIVSDNVEVLGSKIIKDKNVTIIFISEALVRECDGIIPDNVKVVSLPRFLNVALSDFEKESCVFSRVLNEQFIDVLKSLDLPLSKGVIDAFAFDFEQIIYHENSKYLTIQKLALESQPLILSLDKPVNAERFHRVAFLQYERCESLSNLYILAKERNSDTFKFEPLEHVRVDFKVLKESVNSLYHDLSRVVENEVSLHDTSDFVTVVGNINNRNYTYSKIALHAVELLSRKYKVSYVPVVDGDKDVEDNKFILNTDGVYGTSVIKPKARNEIQFDSTLLANELIKSLSDVLPQDYIKFVKDSITRYLTLFSDRLYKYLYYRKRISGSKGMLTCLENSFVSRCITDIHHEKKKKTIALQSWRISNSPRNCLPKVMFMGVIDTYQKVLFEDLGFPSSNIKMVGSVNLFDKIDLISEKSNGKNEFLFVLQHSMHKESANALEIIKKYFALTPGMTIYIKPHPHQDVATIELLDKMRTKNVKILSKSSDTYNYVSKCDYIISMFSSVLFESALARKRVIVLNLNSLDDSINYAKMGLGLEVKDYDEFASVLNKINKSEDFSFEDIDRNVDEFFSYNPQFHNRKILFDFINSIGAQ
ncbi:CDP-glycerol glycerophosphotransferase family protein [Vibrio sp. 10N.222.51.E8]|uniref:capsular polysaccharide export protein, LipB/KpsS family n=1 Tax=unclassified Vibrio TaxID=2614977 RepID=UPI0014851FFC|nr:CDP-glycerol glycerophosphotransferase family protein [Vibrio sp. F13]